MSAAADFDSATRRCCAGLSERPVEEVGRLGKRVVLKLDNGDRLIFEPRMTGLVLVADPPTREHLRFRLDLARRSDPARLVLGPPRPGQRASLYRTAIR